MTCRNLTLAVLAIAASLHLAAAKEPAKAATVPAPSAATIPYDELRAHIGERVVVHTTFKSVRTGTLTKASPFEITLSVPTAQGPAELTVPKDTVASVTPAETPAPPPKH
jgi:hypothetical protein